MYPPRTSRWPERLDVQGLIRGAEALRERVLGLEDALQRSDREARSARTELQAARAELQAARADTQAARALAAEREHAERRWLTEIETLRAERAPLAARCAELEQAIIAQKEAPKVDDDRLERLVADLANVRRRAEEAVTRARREERERTLEPVFETYDLLLAALRANPDRDSSWAVGHRTVLAQVEAGLRRLGVDPVGVAGEAFDPEHHEAVGLIEGPSDVVGAIAQQGWSDGSGVLRPAKVLVGRGPAA